MEEKDLFVNEIDRQYGDLYREGKSSATNPDHQLPGDSATVGGESLTPVADESPSREAAKELAEQVKPKDLDDLKVFGYSVLDFVNIMYPNGPNVRHRAALKLFYDFFGTLRRRL